MIGVMGATVNPFSIGVAAGVEGGVDREGTRSAIVMWVVLTADGRGLGGALRSEGAQDPDASLVGWDGPDEQDETTTDKMAGGCRGSAAQPH